MIAAADVERIETPRDEPFATVPRRPGVERARPPLRPSWGVATTAPTPAPGGDDARAAIAGMVAAALGPERAAELRDGWASDADLARLRSGTREHAAAQRESERRAAVDRRRQYAELRSKVRAMSPSPQRDVLALRLRSLLVAIEADTRRAPAPIRAPLPATRDDDRAAA